MSGVKPHLTDLCDVQCSWKLHHTVIEITIAVCSAAVSQLANLTAQLQLHSEKTLHAHLRSYTPILYTCSWYENKCVP